MPSQIPSPSVTSNSELQSLDNEQISNSSYHQHHNHYRHSHYQHHNTASMNDSHTSKTNLYIRGLAPITTDNDLHEMCKK